MPSGEFGLGGETRRRDCLEGEGLRLRLTGRRVEGGLLADLLLLEGMWATLFSSARWTGAV